MENSYLNSAIKQFKYYKNLGDKAFLQLSDADFFYQTNEESNSIAILVKHLGGNMLSRWTNFLTEDGEKTLRNRDDEFINTFKDKLAVIAYWEKGWHCLFNTLNELKPNNLEDIIYIRNQGHTVTEAINRQLCHYSYHIGQLIFLAKMTQKNKWKSLSIPKNDSAAYNAEKFEKEKTRTHFTDDL